MAYQPAPPSYDQSEGFSNAHYMGPNPNYPNAGPESQPFKGMGPPYPQQPYPGQPQPYPGQPQPYPGQTQPYPQQGGIHHSHVSATQYPGTSVHVMSTSVVSPITVVTPHIMGPHPSTVQCPNCNEQVTTVVRTESGMLTWLACGLLFLFGCGFGCCLIPFCIDDCKDSYHSCPRCNVLIGKYARLR